MVRAKLLGRSRQQAHSGWGGRAAALPALPQHPSPFTAVYLSFSPLGCVLHKSRARGFPSLSWAPEHSLNRNGGVHTSATESTHAQISGTVTNTGSLYQEAAQASEGSSSCKYCITGSPLLGFSFWGVVTFRPAHPVAHSREHARAFRLDGVKS